MPTRVQLAILADYVYNISGAQNVILPSGFDVLTTQFNAVSNYDPQTGFYAIVVGQQATDQFGINIQGQYQNIAIDIRGTDTQGPDKWNNVGADINFFSGLASGYAGYGFGYLQYAIDAIKQAYPDTSITLVGQSLAGAEIQAFWAVTSYFNPELLSGVTGATFNSLQGANEAHALGVPYEFFPNVAPGLTNYAITPDSWTQNAVAGTFIHDYIGNYVSVQSPYPFDQFLPSNPGISLDPGSVYQTAIWAQGFADHPPEAAALASLFAGATNGIANAQDIRDMRSAYQVDLADPNKNGTFITALRDYLANYDQTHPQPAYYVDQPPVAADANPFNLGGVLDQGFVPQVPGTEDQSGLNGFTNSISGAFTGVSESAFQNPQSVVTSTSSIGDYGYATVGPGTQSIGGSSFVTVNAGVTVNPNATPTAFTPPSDSLVQGTPDAFLIPTQVPTSIDNTAFQNAETFQGSATQSANVGYASVNFSGAGVPQATSVMQDLPVNTIDTGAGLGASFGGFDILSGIGAIFGDAVDGIFGVFGDLLGGGASFDGGSAPGDDSEDGGGGSVGGSGGGSPVVLDLSGKGIKITPLSASNMFFDMNNTGHAQHTAWAGAGNGVLVYDPSGGAVTSANQVNFTLWDPGAKTGMQALEAVFDTNHDGKLNSSDAQWSSFRILVTNADGTTTLETLAQAGVTSINLVPNSYTQLFTDGSSIGRAVSKPSNLYRFAPRRRPRVTAKWRRAA